LIIRAWNFGTAISKGSIVFNDKISEALDVSHVETDLQVCPYTGSELKTNIPAKGMNTYRTKFSGLK
jgi:hypothetical protein